MVATRSQISGVGSSKKSELSVFANNSTKAGVIVETMSAPNPVRLFEKKKELFKSVFNFSFVPILEAFVVF